MTVIGAGVDQTVIGPAASTSGRGLCYYPDRLAQEHRSLQIADLTVENVGIGIAEFEGFEGEARIEVRDCLLRNCGTGTSRVDVVENSTFGGMTYSGVFNAEGVSGCTFDGSLRGIHSLGLVENCTFARCETALEGGGTMRGCTLDPSVAYGVKAMGQLLLENNDLHTSRITLQAAGEMEITGSGNFSRPIWAGSSTWPTAPAAG